MRNVVTLSDIPRELHDWLRTEAAKRSKAAKKRIGISQVVTQAVKEYRERSENSSRRTKLQIPIVEIFRKKIMPAEFERGCICVPVNKHSHFGVGNTIIMKDAEDGSTVLVPVGSQHRLDMRNWYNRHAQVKSGDEIIFEQQRDGFINIKVLSI